MPQLENVLGRSAGAGRPRTRRPADEQADTPYELATPLRATDVAQAAELQIDRIVAGLVHRAVPFGD